MRVSFVGQPFDEYGWTADWLNEALIHEGAGTLQIAVAWAKRSGLLRLQESIRTFRDRGGTVTAIIGIDEGGATKQGLELALGTFDETFVFHDESSRTFHPKVYLLCVGDSARLIIGSNNMTAGGLYSNFEAALVCDLDLMLEEDHELYREVSSWFEILHSDEVCRPLTPELLKTLVANPEYRIGDEDRPNRSTPQARGYYDGVTVDRPASRIFGMSSSPKKGLAPRLKTATSPRGRRSRRQPATRPRTSVPSKPLRWYKRMSAADAQQPASSKTNPTGSLKLTQAGHDIDQTTFFRHDMFGSATWIGKELRRGVLEEATVPIDVFVEGVSKGTIDFKVDHAEYRVAGQGNVSTWLHWGTLRKTLQRNDYTSARVTLERRGDGSYRLEITHETS
jgi:HKD family nuclease